MVWKGLVLEIVVVVDAAVRMARARSGARVGGGMVIDRFGACVSCNRRDTRVEVGRKWMPSCPLERIEPK